MKSLLLPLRRHRAGFALTLILLLGMANSVLALNLTVTNAADSGPGTLRQAINASAPGGTIDFDPALNGQTITLTSAQLGIGRDLTIDGPGLDKLTISGNDQFRIFEIAAGKTVSISGLTLSHGKAQGADGAKRGEDCQDVVLGGVVVGHHLVLIPATAGLPGRGGAVLNAGQLTMSHCRLENNSAIGGAGGSALYFYSYCSNPVLGTLVSSGDSGAGGNGEGGGIYNNGNLVLTACTFENNSANGGLVGYTRDNGILIPGSNARCGDGGGGLGGAVANSGDLTVQECTFHQNAARGHDPSAVEPTSGQIYPVEANIAGNGGVGYGGAIFSSAPTVTTATVIKNSTFAENHAVGGRGGWSRLADPGFVERPGNGGDGAGGGIKTDIAPESSSVCTIWYCTFSGNTTQGGPGGFVDFDESVVGNPGGAYGGGVHARYDNTTVMWSSIVAGNSGMHPDVSSAITSYGFNLIGAINGSSGWTADDLTGYIDNNGTDFSLDPLLGPLQDNGGPTKTILPEQGSAAIDHGGGSYTPTTDQRGFARVVDLAKYSNAAGGSDIGAVEVAGYNGTPRIWVNPNGGNWSVTNNWSGGVPPGSNDVAVITLNGNYTVTLDVSPTIAGLVLGATVGTNKQTLATGGQTLSLNGSSIVNAQGVFSHSGGTLGGSGEFAVHGAMNWNSGTINRSGGLSIGSSGTLNITGAGNNHDLPNTTVTNSGKVVWSGGNVRGGGTTIVNKGEWDAQGDVPISQSFSGPVTVDNTGTFKKSAGSGALALGANVFMKNSGLVDVQAGRVDFNGGGTNDAGTFNAGTNGAVNFNTSFTFNHGTKLLGAGSKQFVAGTFTLNGTITTTNLTHTGGTLTGSPTLDGEFIWSSGALWNGVGAVTIAPTGNLKILGSGTHDLSGRILTNNGTVMWTAGIVYDGAGGHIYNNGLWDAQVDNTLAYNGGFAPTPIFFNAGTFRKSAGNGTTLFSGCAFNNTGTLDVQSGTVSLAGGGTNYAGIFNTASNAALTFDGNYFFNDGSQFAGSGNMRLVFGTFTLNGNISMSKLTQTGGTLAGTHVLTGNFVWGGGSWWSGGATTIPAGSLLTITNGGNKSARLLTNNGTVRWTGGIIYDGQNGHIYNNGLWDAQADNTLAYNGGFSPSSIFFNAGTFRKSVGNGTTLFSGCAFNNTGTNEVQTGTVSLAGGGTNYAGIFNTASNASLTLDGNYFFNDGSQFTGSGNMRLVTGTFTLSGNISMSKLTQTGGTLAGTHALTGNFVWGGGSWWTGGATTIPAGSLLTITNGGNKSARLLTNNGTVRWTGGTIYDGAGGYIYNNGLWDAQADNTLAYNGGFSPTSIFFNAGTFRKSAGNGTSLFSGCAFNNTGTNEVQTGTVSLVGGGTNYAGIFNTASNAALTFDDNYFFNDGSQFTGSGNMRLVFGTFTLNGNITMSRLTQTGGTLAGTHALAGNFVWGGGSWWSGGGTTIPAGSLLTITNGGNKSARLLTNNGTVRWTGGIIYDGQNGHIYNNGLWDAQVDSSLAYNGGFSPSSIFFNAGTFRKSAGSGTTLFNGCAFNNTSTLDVQSGTVSLSEPRNLTGGTINVGISSLSSFGKVSLSGAAGLTGKFSAKLIGSYVPTPGTAFPVISYGSLSGSFGSFNLPANNSWQTNYGSTTFTLTAQSVLSYPPVQLESPQISNSTFMFTMQTVSNLNYTVLYNDNLTTTNWMSYTDVSGDGSLRQISIARTNSQRFFRVSQP